MAVFISSSTWLSDSSNKPSPNDTGISHHDFCHFFGISGNKTILKQSVKVTIAPCSCAVRLFVSERNNYHCTRNRRGTDEGRRIDRPLAMYICINDRLHHFPFVCFFWKPLFHPSYIVGSLSICCAGSLQYGSFRNPGSNPLARYSFVFSGILIEGIRAKDLGNRLIGKRTRCYGDRGNCRGERRVLSRSSDYSFFNLSHHSLQIGTHEVGAA